MDEIQRENRERESERVRERGEREWGMEENIICLFESSVTR